MRKKKIAEVEAFVKSLSLEDLSRENTKSLLDLSEEVFSLKKQVSILYLKIIKELTENRI